MNQHGGYTGDNKNILDFSININPMGMPKTIREALSAALDAVDSYPEIDGKTAKLALAKALDCHENQLILGNGASELIYLFPRSFAPGNAWIISPTFNEYKRALKLNNWTYAPVYLNKENGFRLKPEQLLKAYKSNQPDVIYICNPNNPTGTLYSLEEMKTLMDSLPEKVMWFIDESFIEFTGENSCDQLVREGRKNIFILRSLTKFFALPGLRLGYAIASEATIKKLNSYKEPWTTNTLALIAAEKIYDDLEYIQKTKDYIQKEQQRVFQEFQNIVGIRPYPSGADFHLIALEKNNTDWLLKALNEKNIHIRTCEDFYGLEGTHFRVAIKSTEDNNRLIKALKEVMEASHEA